MNEQFPATKPTKSKRRKSAVPKSRTREPSPDEDLYAIKDIVDEKLVRGNLLYYKVDWADNPTTGERYDPTWVIISDTLASSFPATPLTTLSRASRNQQNTSRKPQSPIGKHRNANGNASRPPRVRSAEGSCRPPRKRNGLRKSRDDPLIQATRPPTVTWQAAGLRAVGSRAVGPMCSRSRRTKGQESSSTSRALPDSIHPST